LAARVLKGDNLFSDSASFLKCFSFLKKEAFDLTVFFRPRLGTAAAAFLAGVPKRLGTGYRGYSFLYNLKHYEHRKTGEKHEAEYSLSLLIPLGVEKPLVFDPVEVDPGEARQVWNKFGLDFSKNWIAIHPGSGGSAPNWPKERYVELAARLLAEGFSILWTGGPAELQGVEEVGVSLAGKTEVWDLACLYSLCKAVIAPSTGPLHLASLVGTPVVGLFSPSGVVSPKRWRPLGKNARVVVPDEKNNGTKTLDGLEVEKVLSAVHEILSGASVFSR
jgi:heptosyltransferase-2